MYGSKETKLAKPMRFKNVVKRADFVVILKPTKVCIQTWFMNGHNKR